MTKKWNCGNLESWWKSRNWTWTSRFTSTLRIGCCRSSSGTQQALARQRRRDEGAENQLEKCSKSGRKEEAEHILPLVPPLCVAGACCVPELGLQQPILRVDVNPGSQAEVLCIFLWTHNVERAKLENCHILASVWQGYLFNRLCTTVPRLRNGGSPL